MATIKTEGHKQEKPEKLSETRGGMTDVIWGPSLDAGIEKEQNLNKVGNLVNHALCKYTNVNIISISIQYA